MHINEVLMRKKRRDRITRRNPPGAAPGTISVDPEAPKPVIRVIAYGPDQIEESQIDDLDAVQAFMDRHPVTWVNVDGLGDAGVLSSLAARFNLHKLAMEDVVNVHQRAKVERYRDNLFIVARMAMKEVELSSEQVSLFLGKGFVLTFQERPGDCLDPVRQRLRTSKGQIRSSGADYLAYTILDAIVDQYFPVLEAMSEQLDVLEDEVLEDPESRTVSRIHEVRRDLLMLRRAIWPLREAVNSLLRDSESYFSEDTRLFLRDLYDHTIQVMDLIESFREVGAGLVDVYLSSVSNRMNEVMKVLTMIATIFIPLSFIAGLYGMNFNPAKSPFNMPELNWYFGYPFAVGLMALVALGMLWFFKRKRWF